MTTHTVYAAMCGAETVYVGATSDLVRRVTMHEALTPWWASTVGSVRVISEHDNPADAGAAEFAAITALRPRMNIQGVTQPYHGYHPNKVWRQVPAPESAQVLRTAEVARRLSVPRATVYRMVKAGVLERVYVGGRIPRITAESVEAALRTSERAS